jgi:PIN domain nuclease of toxin-antitoxin system
MARYLLDSNAYLNFRDNSKAIRKEAFEAITDAENILFVSLASLWEMAIKTANGKLPTYARLIASGPAFLEDSLRDSNFTFLPIALRHALAAAALPQHHRDPFERMLIAQALDEGLILITNDRIFALYPGLQLLPA